MDQSQTLFLLHIMDGYSFRNTINIVKSETDFATMVLSPKMIEISFINNTKLAVHKIVLNTPEFAMYHYNIRDSDGNLLPEYPIAFETNEMFNTTKGIGRRDGIRIYWLSGDSKLNVQHVKTGSKDPGRAGAFFVNIHNMEYTRYDISPCYKTEPNVRVQSKDFADLCGQANSLKCSTLEIIGHHNSVTFKSILPNNTMASINRFVSQSVVPREIINISNLDELENKLYNLSIAATPPANSSGLSLKIVKSEDLMTVKVPIITVKALSKIHNISPSGTLLRFYFAANKPTKLESPIGTYGTYTICLRNPRT